VHLTELSIVTADVVDNCLPSLTTLACSHPQSNGILAPIANVAGTVAGAAAVAQVAITPNGTSVVLCAAVADTTVASLRVSASASAISPDSLCTLGCWVCQICASVDCPPCLHTAWQGVAHELDRMTAPVMTCAMTRAADSVHACTR